MPTTGNPPATALWWFLPVADEPGWYHIVGARGTGEPGMMLRFNNNGNVYPKPYYLGDEEWTVEMEFAKFQLRPASHEVARTSGLGLSAEMYYIVTGPSSGMANEMVTCPPRRPPASTRHALEMCP